MGQRKVFFFSNIRLSLFTKEQSRGILISMNQHPIKKIGKLEGESTQTLMLCVDPNNKLITPSCCPCAQAFKPVASMGCIIKHKEIF